MSAKEKPIDTPSYILRPPRPEDFAHIVRRQTELYGQEYGWDDSYADVAREILHPFVTHPDPVRERGWIAEQHGEIVGCVFCMKQDEETARLRLLYVEPCSRGSGLGRRLVEEVVHFAQDHGYRTITLWTQHVLESAHRLYQQAGFVLQESTPRPLFGHDLIGQIWSLDLRR